ncbi:MAG: hypothetical protein P4M14_10700 [Gammaproteobacteria bacterium]|nr:hypothetical protein [Gammaproteobacteria bacterium]
MPTSERIRDQRFRKRIPLWKWILIIFIVIAMPLFFSFYRSYQLQQILGPVDATKPLVSQPINNQTNPRQ